jgi:predicted RNase H-like HicB family nuclease
MQKEFTAIIEREDDWYVALCPELDIASQGKTVDEARKNLQEALKLFFETASNEEIRERLYNDLP